jgi:transposase
VSLAFPVRRCWMKRAQQTRLPVHSDTRQLTHLIAALDWQSTQVHGLSVARKNSHHFMEFIEWLCLTVYPHQPLVIVMDNVSYHRSADVQALLALLTARVQVVWLPKYSPDMNPIERFWLFLKNRTFANRLFPSLDALRDQLHRWLTIQNTTAHPARFVNSFR